MPELVSRYLLDFQVRDKIVQEEKIATRIRRVTEITQKLLESYEDADR